MTTLRYAHCVKFTIGQLDREPWSQYELREIEVNTAWCAGWDGEADWWVLYQGTKIGFGETEEEALYDAAYRLMENSRNQLSKPQKVMA